jgi:hypothetical protein
VVKRKGFVNVVLAWSDRLNAWLIRTPSAVYFTRHLPTPVAGALDKSRRYSAVLLDERKAA